MKSRKKNIWLWIIGLALCAMVPALLIAKSLWADVRAKVGRDKSFLATIIDDYYHKKNVDERIIDPSRNQVHNVMNAATKEKGKFLSIGNTDTIPSLEDARNRCFELSFNVPVQFEKGFKTLTFRVRNLTEGEKVVWVEGSDGILPPDNVKSRLLKRLP